MKIVHKQNIAKGQGTDYVLSDDSLDRMGDRIDTAGWQLEQFRKHPIALFNHNKDAPIGRWKNIKIVENELRGTLEFASKGTSPRIDELHALAEQGILRAVSVGFKPLEMETFKNGDEVGLHFKRQELLEASLVSVPANPNALQIARSLKLSDEVTRMVFGEHAEHNRAQPQRLTGGHAETSSIGKAKAMTTPMQARIEDAQRKLVGFKDSLAAHLDGLDNDNVTDEQMHVTDDLNNKIEQTQRNLESLRKAEANLASQALAVRPTAPAPAVQFERPRLFATPAKKTAPGDYFLHALAAMVVSRATRKTPEQALCELYGEDGKIDDPHMLVLRVLGRSEGIDPRDMVTRAASAPADTTTSGWASQLVNTSFAEFMALLLPASVLPGLSARGLSLSFGRSGIIQIPTRLATPTIAGSFVGQGSPIPVRQGAFSAQTLTPKKLAVISVFTREIGEHSTPAIEGLIRNAIQEDTSVAIDTILLDNVAATTIRPAGLRAGVSVTTATAGGGFAALVGDIKALLGALITGSSGNIRNPVWIMNPIQAVSVSLTQNAGGDFPFANEINNNRMQGYPVVQSATVTAGMVLLVDAADFVTVEGPPARFDISDTATLHMEDTTPAAIGTVGAPNVVAAPVRSLWQTDSIGLRMLLDLNWTMRRTGVVAWTQAVTW